jgi:hypothetical protein
MLTLQFGATEIFQDLLPVGRIVVPSQVWLKFATEYFECCALSNSICSYKTKHLPWSRSRQPVKFEAVGRITMSDFGLQVCRQIDDVDGAEGALLGADTATDTEPFGYVGNFGLWGDLNAELPGSNDRT